MNQQNQIASFVSKTRELTTQQGLYDQLVQQARREADEEAAERRRRYYLNTITDLLTELEIRHQDNFEGYLKALNDQEFMQKYTQVGVSDFAVRDDLCRRFSWACPNAEALELIAAQGPIIEIGAGAGYWAHLLRSRYHVNILAYDHKPPSKGKSHYHKGCSAWTGVVYGRPVKTKKHPDRALFLCWPPMYSTMAEDALKHYKGDTVIHVGEQGGCTGTPEFEETLWDEWEEVKTVHIPQWRGIHDYLILYKRK